MAIGPIVYPTLPATTKTSLNITAPTIIKASPGVVGTITVVAAGSGNGAVCDCATTGAAGNANHDSGAAAEGQGTGQGGRDGGRAAAAEIPEPERLPAVRR